jgi:hypothetical protein
MTRIARKQLQMNRSIFPFTAVALVALMAGGNPTIEQEVAGRCRSSVSEYQKAEASLGASSDGTSVRVGGCRLKRESNEVIKGEVGDWSPPMR